jgi:hypothetical protein
MEDIESDAAMRDHSQNCVSCATFAQRTRTQDATLANALNIPASNTLAARILFAQRSKSADADNFDLHLRDATRIGVPHDLADRIIAQMRDRADADDVVAKEQVFALHGHSQGTALGYSLDGQSGKRQSGNSQNGGLTSLERDSQPTVDDPNVVPLNRRQVLGRFALAASIAVGVASAALIGIAPEGSTLASEIVEHVQAEPWLLESETVLDRGYLEPVLQAIGVDLDDMPGDVVTAFVCPFRPIPSLHMVLKGTHDKVTVLVMPGDKPKEIQRAVSGELHGLVIPVRYGSIAVVGNRREDLSAHAKRIRKMLRWRL